MKQTKIIMGMPITIEVVGDVDPKDVNKIFNYFKRVDARYSTYKSDSEITKINQGLPRSRWSHEMVAVLKLCEQTKLQTSGFFDVEHNGQLDPSGLVKGWAINNAAKKLTKYGYRNFYIEAGGDIQVSGHNAEGEAWAVGIRNPFNINEIIKVVKISDKGLATSGTYIRGEHVYNPFDPKKSANPIKSLTVIGPNIYEADRFATAALAMGAQGIGFIDKLPGFEAYMVDANSVATLTKGFEAYVEPTS